MSKTMEEFDDSLDEQVGTKPKPKTPKEMLDNPHDSLDNEPTQTLQDQQNKLDKAWQKGVGEPKIGHDATIVEPPGSGANEGKGKHKWDVTN